MEKKLLIMFTIILCITLTGCGSKSSSNILKPKIQTITCIKSEKDENGYNTKETMTIEYKENTILKITDESTSEMDSEYLDLAIALANGYLSSYNELDGFNMIISKTDDKKLYSKYTIDYDKLDIQQLEKVAKDNNSSTDDFHINKDNYRDFNNYKETELKDYNCK